MIRQAVLLATIFSLGALVSPQNPSGSSGQQLELSKRLVIARQLNGLMQVQHALGVHGATQPVIAHPRLPFQTETERATLRWSEKYLPADSIAEIQARVLAHEFTEVELRDLLAFYKSPLGQRFSGAQTRLRRATTEAVARILDSHRQELRDSLRSIAIHGK